MPGGWRRLALASAASLIILAVAVSGTDLTMLLLARIALALIWRGRPQDPKKGSRSR